MEHHINEHIRGIVSNDDMHAMAFKIYCALLVNPQGDKLTATAEFAYEAASKFISVKYAQEPPRND